MFVKPGEGLTVREPVSLRILPAEGQEVPENGFWMRRLRDGDVVETKPPAEVTQAAMMDEAAAEHPALPAPEAE